MGKGVSGARVNLQGKTCQLCQGSQDGNNFLKDLAMQRVPESIILSIHFSIWTYSADQS